MNQRSPLRVPARYAWLLLDLLAESAVDAGRVLAEANLDSTGWDGRDAWLRPDEVARLVTVSQRHSGRSDLGFALGQRIRPTTHGLLGYGLLCCRDLDESLRLAQRHHHLMSEAFGMDYRPGRHGADLVFTPSRHFDTPALHFHCEVVATSLHAQVQATLGDDLHGFECHLSMPEPAHLRHYAALAPARFHFDESHWPGVHVRLTRELLQRPLPLADARVVREIDAHCSALGRPRGEARAKWGEYVAMLLRQVEGDFFTLETLARRLDLSPRTIERRLRREDLCFRDVAHRVRFERAREMLGELDATVAQVACRLGFRDAANFSRAFRREVGMSPSEYRHQRG